MAGLNRPGKSPIKLARFYKRLGTTVLKVTRISNNSGADFSGVVDAPIREANPTTNYDSADFLALPNFDIAFTSAGDRTNTLIKFTGLSNVAPGTVLNAKLRIYMLQNNSGAVLVNANALLRNYVNNQATWNVFSTGNSWQTAGGLGALDISSTLLGQFTTGAANQYYEFSSAALNTYVENILNGTVDNGILLSYANQVSSNGFTKYYSSEAADGFRPELVFSLTPNSGGSSVTGTSIDGLDVAITNISPVASITGNSVDLTDTSTSSISPRAAITSAISDLSDVALANITSITAITSAAIDLTDLSNTSISPVSSISGVSTDQADLSNALISPVQSASISSAVIDLTDVAQASISPSVAITGTSNDLTDTGSASISPISSVSGSSADLRDVSASTISPLTSLTASNNDGADVSNASINATVSVTSATVDRLDVSTASISPITSLNGASFDGQDIGDALISPAPTFNNLTGLSVDGADSSSALISPINALSSNTIDGADISQSGDTSVNVLDTHDYIPDFWFKLWEQKKKKPVNEIVELIQERIEQETQQIITKKAIKAELVQYNAPDLNNAIAVLEKILAKIQQDSDDEDEELLIIALL